MRRELSDFALLFSMENWRSLCTLYFFSSDTPRPQTGDVVFIHDLRHQDLCVQREHYAFSLYRSFMLFEGENWSAISYFSSSVF